MRKIFIVGIARSGTTLLQSIIGSHPEIFTFPETHFLDRTIPKRKLEQFFHRINSRHKNEVKKFLEQEGKSDLYIEYSENPFSVNKWTKYLLSTLENMCEDRTKNILLEKTPMHLYYLDLIERNCEECLYIHTIREPFSNIAAVYDVSRKHPDSFAQNTIEKAIERYKKEILISEKYLKHPKHFFVHYEELVNEPVKVINRLCEFLGIEFTPKLLEFQNSVDKIVSKDEKWKENNKNTLKITDKLKERISQEELDLIEKSLDGFNPKLLEYYEKN